MLRNLQKLGENMPRKRRTQKQSEDVNLSSGTQNVMTQENEKAAPRNDFRERGAVDVPLQQGQENNKDGPAGQGLMNQQSAVPEQSEAHEESSEGRQSEER